MDSSSASPFSSSSSTSTSSRSNSSGGGNNNNNSKSKSNNDLVPANNNQSPLLRNIPPVISLESLGSFQRGFITKNHRGDGPFSEHLRNQMDDHNRENGLQTSNNETANCPRGTSEEVFFLKMLLLKTRRKKAFLALKLNQEKETEAFLLRQHQNSLLVERRNQQPTLNQIPVSPPPAALVLSRLDDKTVIKEPELALPRLDGKTIIQQPGSSSGQNEEQGETESPTAKFEIPKRKRGRPRKDDSTKDPAPKRSKGGKPKGKQKPKANFFSLSGIEIRDTGDDTSSITNNDAGMRSSSGGNERESESVKPRGKQRSGRKKISLFADDVKNSNSANDDASSSSSKESKSEKSNVLRRSRRKKFSLSSSESEDSESLLLDVYCTAGIF